MKFKAGRYFVSYLSSKWHILVAVHPRLMFYFIKPPGKPSYRRIYFGPFEIEWSKQ